jgi:hypothetical protein
MRLSDVLNKAPSQERLQVERFLGHKRLPWGKNKTIEVGTVIHNFNCMTCGDDRTFISGNKLTALIAGENMVSIDIALKCPVCNSSVESWYLIKSEDDLYSLNPTVYLVRYTENRRGAARGVGVGAGQFEDLLDQAHIAFANQLGAGSMVYLRKIFEMVTYQVAATAGIATLQPNGHRRSFKSLLTEVDREHRIIPSKFSDNGYTLFSELSEVIHGDSDEEEALRKFSACRQLVLSVVQNVKGDQEIAAALDTLGWDLTNVPTINTEEVAI